MANGNTQSPITNGTVTFYNRANDALFQKLEPVGDPIVNGDHGHYTKENLPAGQYYFIAEAPSKGTIVRPFDLPDPANIDDVFKNIVVQMTDGVDNVYALIKDKDDAVIDDDITVHLSKIVGEYQAEGDNAGKWRFQNVSIKHQLFEVIPDDAELDNLQNFKTIYYVTDGLNISIILYPPVTVQFMIVDHETQNPIPNPRAFLGGTMDPAKEVYPTGNLFQLDRQADGTLELFIMATGYTSRVVERSVSWAYTDEAGSPGSIMFYFSLHKAIGPN